MRRNEYSTKPASISLDMGRRDAPDEIKTKGTTPMRKFMTSLTTIATLTLAAVPALGLMQAAHAAEPTATVSLVGLNLSNPAHAAEFAARLDVAAETVCRDMVRSNPSGDFTIAGCKVSVRKQAAAQLSKGQRQGLQVASRAIPVTVAAR